jgi:predicted nucleic acid-binding protein
MAGMLLDTSALYAIADRDDKWHGAMVEAVEACVAERIVPVSVLAEACYLLGRYLGPAAERQLLRVLERADAVLQKYADANIGFVDASIVAIAERLKVGTIATTDRRHFGMLRPKHCRAFNLVP